MVRSTSVMAVLVAAGMIVAAPAEAAKWRGKTGQGRGVSSHTDASGHVNFAHVRYRVPCRDGSDVRGGVHSLPPYDTSAVGAFADRGPYRFRVGRIRVRANASIEGGLRRSGRWTGKFSVRMRLIRNGRLLTTCRLRTGWKASPV